MKSLKIRGRLRVGAVAVVGMVSVLAVSLAAATTDPRSASAQRVAPVPRMTAASAAAARAAAEARAAPVTIPVELPRLSAEQIAERNAAARGGLAAWRQVKAMTMAGRLDAGKPRQDGGQVALVAAQDRKKAKAEARKAIQEGRSDADPQKMIQLPFQMDLKRPLLQRLEVPFQGQTAVQVYDGVQGWKLRPYLGRREVEAFSAQELQIAASQQELDGPLIDHRAKGIQVEVEGGEMLEGRSAYRLRLTLKNGDVRHLWVDAQTFLDLKIEGAPRRWDGKLRTVTTWFRDYKAVGGLQIAHRLETRLDGVPGSESIYIDQVALNPVLADSRFARPE
jgi:hypothetical protein